MGNPNPPFKFQKGNQYAVGAKHPPRLPPPPLPTQQELLDAMQAVCTPQVMREVTLRHLELIRQGRSERTALAALELWYDRLVGKMTSAVDVKVTQGKTFLDPRNYSDAQIADMLAILENPQPPPMIEAVYLEAPPIDLSQQPTEQPIEVEPACQPESTLPAYQSQPPEQPQDDSQEQDSPP